MIESEVDMRTSRALTALTLAAMLLAPRLAGAWCVEKYQTSTGYGSWENVPVKYRISANLTDTAILAAIDKAFQTWGSVNCSKLTFQKDATFTFASHPFKQATGAIFIYWITDAKDWTPTGVGQENYIFRYGGFDLPAGHTTGYSIAVNAFKYTWKATGAGASEFDVQNALTHFLGYAIGLAKSGLATSVMGMTPGYALSPNMMTLTQDDKDAVVFLYPNPGAGCTIPAAPGANNCSGAAPPTGDGLKKDSGPPPPAGDGKPPAGDGTKPPAGDGQPPVAGDGQPPVTPGIEAGTTPPPGGCTSQSQCASDELCTIDGRCEKKGDGGGCGCEVGAQRGTPALALLLVGLGAILLRRRRR